MLPRFKNVDRDQPTLIISSLRDLIPDDHPVHYFIDAIKSFEIPLEKFHVNYLGTGDAQYSPMMMLTMIIYCFANRIFSYREIAKATYDNLPVRFITGDLHPCFKTICNFRKNNAELFTEVFLKLVQLAKTSGLVTLGTVSLDSSQFKANASKDQNYNILALEREKKECQQILNTLLEEEKAQKEDKTPIEKDLPDDLNTPQKRTQAIKKAKLRLASLEKAEKALDTRAEEEFNKEKENYKIKMAQRKAKEEQKQKVYGKEPQEPKEKKYNINWQGNSTDPDSRLMIHHTKHSPVSQNYNVQTIVDNDSRLVVAGVVTNNASDGGQLLPMVEQLQQTIGKPQTVLADQGYINSSQIQKLESSGIEILIPVGNKFVIDKHAYRIADQDTISTNESANGIRRSEGDRLLTGQRKSKTTADPGRTKVPYTDPRLVEKQKQMQEAVYHQRYKKRGSTIEPVFGIIKNVFKFVQFRYRGFLNVQSEMTLVYTAYNLKRLFALGFNFKTLKR